MENAPNEASGKAADFIVVIVSSTAAPLISHILSILFGPTNGWDTDRLVVLYFASLSGFVISNKVKRIAANSNGLRFLNYSDVLWELIWLLPITIVAFCYKSLLCLLFLICYMLISLVLLRKDWDIIRFSYPKLIYILIITILMIAIGNISGFASGGEALIPQLILYIMTLALLSYVFDKIEIFITKNMKRHG